MASSWMIEKGKPIRVAVDCGIGMLKAVAVEYPDHRVLMPHAVRLLSDEELEKEKRQDPHSRQIFKYKGKWWAVGTKAEDLVSDPIQAGTAKYLDDYYAILINGLFTEFFKQSLPDNPIHVMATLPTSDEPFESEMIANIQRGHVITFMDGEKWKFGVPVVSTVFEGLAAGLNATMTYDAKIFLPNMPSPSEEIAILTLGTGIINFHHIRTSGFVDTKNAVSLDFGVGELIKAMNNGLRHSKEYKHLFVGKRGTNVLNPTKAREALGTGCYRAGGISIPVHEAYVMPALETLTRSIRKAWIRDFQGLSWDAIIMAGGIMVYGGYYEYIRDQIFKGFNMEAIYPASIEREDMIWADVEGARKSALVNMRKKGSKF